MPRANSSYKIFVSHATADKWIATRLCEQLESTGAVYFRDDQHILAGNDIPDDLRNEIATCSELVALITPESVNSEWVYIEIAAAWMMKKRIICVLCHVSTDKIPNQIKLKKAIKINELDKYLDEIRERILKSVDQQRASKKKNKKKKKNRRTSDTTRTK